MTAGHSKIGVEIEFAGMEPQDAAACAVEVLGGQVEMKGPHVALAVGTELGRLTFELDTRYAKPAAQPGLIDQTLESLHLRETAADMLSVLVPVELVTEPLTRAQIPTLARLIEALRKRGAQGTRSSAINAFGMHLNMALEPTEGQQAQERAVRIAVAFACVEPWLRRGMGLDLLRRASPFVDPYPTGWLRVASEWAMAGEWPDLETFVAVYGEWNHTRNRGLDLWPLLGWFDRAMADAALGEPVKNARPAFHYRLPDSRIELVDWNIGAEIARWDRIEALADRPEDLAEAAAVCHAMLEGDLPRAEYDARIAGLIT